MSINSTERLLCQRSYLHRGRANDLKRRREQFLPAAFDSWIAAEAKHIRWRIQSDLNFVITLLIASPIQYSLPFSAHYPEGHDRVSWSRNRYKSRHLLTFKSHHLSTSTCSLLIFFVFLKTDHFHLLFFNFVFNVFFNPLLHLRSLFHCRYRVSLGRPWCHPRLSSQL
ncbi:hypothetical protein IW261DRAFT_419048 [Armillaria novae-zelandiae]|uniref:Uncharacterized protein n=1 Tax=Armillaria novae-zelandiae TaxID=153914 RepID=A0AA39P2F8_9AGAR|nr:hypothetical protein IW261DRAFT_419048 [Armillaria novae-zelandiae]